MGLSAVEPKSAKAPWPANASTLPRAAYGVEDAEERCDIGVRPYLRGLSPVRLLVNDQSPIEFSVKYRLSEYLGIVRAHVVATAIPKDMGRFQRALHLGLLSMVATPVFFYKSWRVGVCSFKIDSAGITRGSKGGTLIVPWSEVVAIHRYDPGYLIEKEKGAMPIPFRALSSGQLSRLTTWFAPHLPRDAT